MSRKPPQDRARLGSRVPQCLHAVAGDDQRALADPAPLFSAPSTSPWGLDCGKTPDSRRQSTARWEGHSPPGQPTWPIHKYCAFTFILSGVSPRTGGMALRISAHGDPSEDSGGEGRETRARTLVLPSPPAPLSNLVMVETGSDQVGQHHSLFVPPGGETQ